MISKASLLIISTLLLLSGCKTLTSVVRELPSDIAGPTVAVGTVALGAAAPLAVVSGIAASAVVETLEPKDEGVNLAEVTNVHAQEVAEAQIQADLIESLGTQGIIGAIGALVVYTLLTWWLGARRARPEEYAAKAKASELETMVEKLTQRVASMREDK